MIKPAILKRSNSTMFSFILIFALIGAYVIFRSFASPGANNSGQHNGNDQQLEIAKVGYITKQLNVASADLKHNPGKREGYAKKMLPIAQERHNMLLDLFKNNPKAAQNLLLNNDGQNIVSSLGADTEQATTISGQLGFFQKDNSSGDNVYVTIKTANKTYFVDTNLSITDSELGSYVSGSGWLLDDQFLLKNNNPNQDSTDALKSGAFKAATPAAITQNNTGAIKTALKIKNSPAIIKTAATTLTPVDNGTGNIGPLSDLVIAGNFGGGSTPYTLSQIQSYYNGMPGSDLASYITENSQGKASLNATFVGVFDESTISCSSNPGALQKALNDILVAQGYGTYDTVGNFIATNYHRITQINNCGGGSYASGQPGGSSSFYITMSYLNRYTLIHEFAHTLGGFLEHGSYLDCAPQVIAPLVSNSFPESQTCGAAEYQDIYDVLGGGSVNATGHLSTYHKIEAGWLDTSQVTTVSTPGTTTYTLNPYEPGNGLVALKIPRSNTNGYYTVEFRQPTGIDSYITNASNCQHCNAAQGALIRLSGINIPYVDNTVGSDSSIIDNSPNSFTNAGSYWPNDDGNDGALLPGQTFTDSQFGITIKTISASSSGLTVQVTLASTSCTNNPAAISAVTPSTQTVSPGQSATYTFVVTNQDSSGCAPNQFRFTPANSPSNDSYSSKQINERAVPDYFTLAPGASTNVTLTVNTTQNAINGNYFGTGKYGPNQLGQFTGWVQPKSFGVSSTVMPSYTLVVAGPSDSTPPSSPTNLTSKTLGAEAATLNWSTSTDNVKVTGYYLVLNNSESDYVTNNSFTYIGLLPSTPYTVTVQAFDGAGNLSPPITTSFSTSAISSTTSPSQVSNISVSANDHGYTANWAAAKDNIPIACYQFGLTVGYGLQCNASGNNLTYSENNLSSQFLERRAIYTFDADGNLSKTDVPQYFTSVQGDPTPPSQPQQLYISSHINNGSNSTNTLTWQPSTDDKSIAGYYINRGCCRIAYTTTNSYTDTGLYNSTSPYRVSAVDSDGSISQISQQYESPGGSSYTSSDVTPPTVSMTSPSNGSALNGTIQFTSNATDNTGMQLVAYYLDGNEIGRVNASSGNYPLSFDTTKYSDGPHWLLAIAEDITGNVTATNPQNVTFNNGGSSVDTIPPTVSITSPGNGASVSGNVSINANATDNVGVTQVVFQVDGSVVATDTTSPYTYTWDTSKVSNGNHTITATAYDATGNTSVSTITVTIANADTIPPSIPTTLSATAAAYNKVNLTWTASTDNVGVAGYYVVRNGITIANLGNVTSYSDTSVLASTSYNYYVMAYDAAGNVSTASTTASVITPPAPDTTPPSQPTNLSGSAISSTQINLSWTASTDNIAVSGYDIYRNNSKIATVTSTTFGDSGLSANTTYSYYVVAKDSSGNVSQASTTINVTTQTAVITTGTLSGIVSKTKGGNLSGSLVSLTVNSKLVSTSTNGSGFYSISSIPAGTYNVSYSASHFTTVNTIISILAGKTTTQNVTLSR